MPPLRDYVCTTCDAQHMNQLVKNGEVFTCPFCNVELKPVISYAANYTIKGDGASTKPKGKGGQG